MSEEFNGERPASSDRLHRLKIFLKSRRGKGLILISTLIFLLGSSIYTYILYQQLKTAFTSTEQYSQNFPTRIYSDLTRITAPQSRTFIEERLKALGYHATKASEDRLVFNLHPIDYPSYLVPDGHPTFEAVEKPIVLLFDQPGTESMLRAIELNGKEIPEIYLEPELVATLTRGAREIRDYVKWNETDPNRKFPPLLWQAIISVEDHKFKEHTGLDPRGILRAIWVNLRTRSFSQGGSTLTQQLVKNLMARRTKNLARKVNELFLALLLEATYSKEQILERYLNEVYLGQIGSLEVHGVSEGARHFFGKKLGELNLGEIAMMAGLIRGPGYYSPYRYPDRAYDRQKIVLKKMVETGQIAQEEADSAVKETVRLAPPQTTSNKAPYFTDFVKAELIRQLKLKMTEQEVSMAGFRVYTTLDSSVNAIAQAAVANGLAELETRLNVVAPDRIAGALASVDHTNGYIRALVGGRSYSKSTFNRILNMKRQVGSTFKPFVYLTAFAKGEDPKGISYGPGYPTEDAPWTLTFDKNRQKWTPKNYEKEHLGWTNMRRALSHSINTVTARVGQEVGISNIIKTARSLGIESDLPPVPSLSLGVAELSPVELLRAYAVLANHGVQDELTVIRAIHNYDGTFYARFIYHPEQVFEPGAVDLVTDMLQSVFTEGTAAQAHAMGFDRPAAGKTGTTSHHRDSWFAGYTPQLTTVVWVGMDQTPAHLTESENDDATENKHNKIKLTGAGAALPIWVAFMKKALSGEPPSPFPVSPYLSNVQIDQRSGKLAPFDCPVSQVVVEKYVKGHEPNTRGCESSWPSTISESVGE